jgi:hypothetical protein
MEKVSLDDVYRLVGELYLSSRIRTNALEQQLTEQDTTLHKLNEEHQRLLSEFQAYKMNHVKP